MKLTNTLLLCAAAGALVFTGCTKTENIDTQNDTGGAVMMLDYRDFNKAASEMLQDLYKSKRLTRTDGKQYVMSCGRIKNDTMQRIDTDQLMWKIEEELTNSGQVIMTAASGQGDNVDSNVYSVREHRKDAEFDQSTVAGSGNLIAPDISISGKIRQSNVRMDGGDMQVEYYFMLQVADLRNGLIPWKKEVMVGKRGSAKNATW